MKMKLLYHDVDCIIFSYIGWGYIAQNWKLSSNFIESYANKLPFHHLSKCQKLSIRIMEKYHYKLDWHSISKYQTLPIVFIDKYHNKLNWKHLSKHQKLTIEIMEKYHKLYKYNWNAISEHQILTEDFIRKFSKNLDWSFITAKYELSEEFMIEFKDKIKWNKLPVCRKYSDAFINAVIDKLPVFIQKQMSYFSDIIAHANMNDNNYWDYVSELIKLDESIIVKYQNVVNWNYIFLYQDLNDAFIEKFKHKINMDYIMKRESIGELFIKKHWNAINWGDTLSDSSNWLCERFPAYARRYPILWDIISKFRIHLVNYAYISEYQFYLNWNMIPQEIIVFVYNHYYNNLDYKLDLKYIPEYIKQAFKQHVFPASLWFPELSSKIRQSKYIVAKLKSPFKLEKDSTIILNDHNGFVKKLNGNYIIL